LACDARAGRTRLASIRTTGLSRASRSFAEADGGIRLVLATLGPGVLGGDRFALTGRVGRDALLVACGQMATPVFAGPAPSRTDARWTVAPGGLVCVLGEPLLLEPGSVHAATATFALSGDGVAVAAETFALRGPARLTLRTQATIDGALAYRDAVETEEDAGAIGSVALVAAGARRRSLFAQRLETLERQLTGVRLGWGETNAAVVARIAGARVWDVRAATVAIAAAARADAAAASAQLAS
jgi:urease accessory protein UreH